MRILKSHKNIEYTSGDKFEGDPRYKDGRYADSINLDITTMPFTDGVFDVVICNHVLEHVLDDASALSEIYRVLKKSKGFAILQVPLSRAISSTIEDVSMATPDMRLKKFGQTDHVRIYAEVDYLARLRSAGFSVKVIDPREWLSESEIKRFGINEEERIYRAEKLL